MSWSITIARLAGSEIRVHLTFLILLGWIAFVDYQQAGAAGALSGVVFLLAVFACVALHELGHALAARRYGIATPDITLLPIGGVARLSRLPERPSEEIVIAVAGPAVNVAIAAVLVLFLHVRFDLASVTSFGAYAHGFFTRLAVVNVFLVLFNLIPAFPMDGGRVLRALLSYRLGRRRATVVAGRIGQVLAVGFAIAGLLSGNTILVLIAAFVFLAAQAEIGGANVDAARGVPVDRAMIRTFQALAPQSTVEQAADAVLKTTQNEFPVVDGAGAFRGILTRADILNARTTAAPGAPVFTLMTGSVPTVASGQPLALAVDVIRRGVSPFVGVVDAGGRFIGYLSRERIAELMAQAAAAKVRRTASA